MYKVMLVDDETWILKDLSTLINWEDFGFTIICETMRPMEAMRLARKKQPDVIFTDISMPGLSGLELAKQVQMRLPNCLIVFISAYDEFDYARQAIHIKAFDYILKPVSRDTLINLLIKLREQIEYNQNKDSMLHMLERSYSLLSVILGEEEDIEVTRPLYEYITSIGQAVTALINGILDEIALNNALNEIRERYHASSIYFRLGKMRTLIILQAETPNQKLGIYREARKLAKAQGVIIGVSKLFSSAEGLKSSCNEAEIASEQQFVNSRGTASIFVYRNPDSKLTYMMAEINSISDKEKMSQFLDLLAQRILEMRANSAQCYKIFTSLMIQISHCDCEAMEYEWNDRKDFLQAFGSLTNMIAFLKSGLTSELIVQESYAKQIVEEVLREMKRDYAQPLRLGDYAKRYSFNYCYFSQIFKKHAKQSFIGYLVKLRIQKAEELILHSRMPLYEISEKVGYDDYSYFSRIFKKCKGISPTDIRE